MTHLHYFFCKTFQGGELYFRYFHCNVIGGKWSNRLVGSLGHFQIKILFAWWFLCTPVEASVSNSLVCACVKFGKSNLCLSIHSEGFAKKYEAIRGVFMIFRNIVQKVSENLNFNSILQRYGSTLWPYVRTSAWRSLGRRDMRRKYSTRI